MENEDLQRELLSSFEIDESLIPILKTDEEKYKAFRKILMQRIEELAEKDMEKLLWILYRIDVSEKKLHQVMQQTAPADFSGTLADLIIERQIQKINTRRQFGEKETEWDFDL